MASDSELINDSATTPVDDQEGDGQGAEERNVILRARGVTVGFGRKIILENLDLNVFSGEILGFVGGSGTGKSVLMRAILGLVPMRAGTVEVFGFNLSGLSPADRNAVDQRWGVLFQHGALFSSLTVIQNVKLPMREHLHLNDALMNELALLKLSLVGLPRDAADKFPSELSGGMIKRASLARALALDPEIVFLDEPTSGLDPIGAAAFDNLIMKLRDTLGLTVYMVTHDLDSLSTACDRIAVLGDRKVLVEGPLEKLLNYQHPWVQEYFRGERSIRLNK